MGGIAPSVGAGHSMLYPQRSQPRKAKKAGETPFGCTQYKPALRGRCLS
jgi:hypothetical protein